MDVGPARSRCRTSLTLRARMAFADCRHDVCRIAFRVLRIEGHSGEAIKNIDTPRAARGPVADRLAARRLERRPRGMDRALLFDVSLSRQQHGTARRLSWNILCLHGGQKAIALRLATKVEINADAQL